MAMGGASCSEGHGFESHHSILNRHFSHLFVLKDENKRGWPIFKKQYLTTKLIFSLAKNFIDFYNKSTSSLLGVAKQFRKHIFYRRWRRRRWPSSDNQRTTGMG